MFFLCQAEDLLKQNLLPEALSLAKEQLKCEPSDIEGYLVVGRALLEMGEIDKTRGMLTDLGQMISALSLVYVRMADLYLEKGYKNDAAFCYRKFLSMNPSSRQAKDGADKLAFLEKQEYQKDDIDDYGIDNLPKPDFFTMTLAELYIKQGHLQMAGQVLEEMTKREPENTNAATMLAAVKAAIISIKTGVATQDDPNVLVETLSCWLQNIDRLNTDATKK